MPHLTIVKMDTVDEARKVVGLARPRWDGCEDSRKIRIDSITFVKGSGERWIDLAKIPLGPRRRNKLAVRASARL